MTVLILMTSIFISRGAGFSNEKLRYIISYKWGVIHKDASEATLSLQNTGNLYNIRLTAKTKPWADKFYKVRDTLSAVVKVARLEPVSYTKLTNEKGKRDIDEIKYTRYKNVTKGECTTRKFRDGEVHTKNMELTATGPVYDMLSIFYYLRTLDYAKLVSQHQVYRATVFSGTKSETITIRCLGKERIKLKNNSEQEAYHIRFKFTQEGGKKSSDDIDTWISTDSRHVPLYLVGKLPIGEVRAYLQNG